MTDDINARDHKPEAGPNRIATWVVALSPIVTLAAVTVYVLALLFRPEQPGWVVVSVAAILIAGPPVGFFGGLVLTSTRKSMWWLFPSAVSVGVVLLLLKLIKAMALITY